MKQSITNFARQLTPLERISRTRYNHTNRNGLRRGFHSSSRLLVVKPFVLADIGEGIREVQIIQWFVQPGARVEQFDKICEVASDKAIVEITSRFDGVIKKLHYDPDAMAQVGKPLCDIDIQGDISAADEKLITPTDESSKSQESSSATKETGESPESIQPPRDESSQTNVRQNQNSKKSGHLATPAVRGLLKEHNLDITHIQGTGRDGRVLKEDIHNHLSSRNVSTPASTSNASTTQTASSTTPLPPPPPLTTATSQAETTVSMTPVQTAMFKAMTRSLSIPHFLYSDEVDLTSLSLLRNTINTSLASQKQTPTQLPEPFQAPTPPQVTKLSYLPFIIKAVSISLTKYPIINATISRDNSSTPKLLHRPSHNIGIAMDTPSGLLVPVIKNVQSLSISSIAHHLSYLQSLAASGKLTSHPDLLSGGTLTVSNIGNIGGGVLSPVLVEGQSVILGVGKGKELPRFSSGKDDTIERRLIAMFSWTADHRVLDGATVARFAENVADLIREPGRMVIEMS